MAVSEYGSLPGLPKTPAKEMAGPTPWSNWVIPGRVIAGAYPASMDDADTERILTTLLELGINTFVCLQAEVNINIPEHAWRCGHGLRPYIKDAQKILSKAHETSNTKITQKKIDFLHLPIIDGNVTSDSALNRLAEDCCDRVIKGEKMYIHCWGGHGRTGTLVAVMLGRLYNQAYTGALRFTQAYHDSRIFPQGVRSPQTPVQRAQVRRLLTAQPLHYPSAAASQAAVSSSITTAPTSIPASVPRSAPPPTRTQSHSSSASRSASSMLLSSGRPTSPPSAVTASMDFDKAGRGNSANSGLRSRTPSRDSALSRYVNRSFGESPMRGSAVSSSFDAAAKAAAAAPTASSVLDKLASEMGRMQLRNLPYLQSNPKPTPARSSSAILRRPVSSELNVR